ncbi:Hypothetical predicted protein [Olea europaea subsp. europaea]|uniref:Transmembrane protein n=1 Tax=Olea europaea subsp. europaea TaxID=158383 RepID=A0A8S0TIA8_OLEEU|nr:Hypothetical predicted protein [Olea europaea subsp. europaea]
MDVETAMRWLGFGCWSGGGGFPYFSVVVGFGVVFVGGVSGCSSEGGRSGGGDEGGGVLVVVIVENARGGDGNDGGGNDGGGEAMAFWI